jgi:ABC-type Mn2+/Zn2+ transport system ATPase subunit
MRQHRQKWTRFYYESPSDEMSWAAFERALNKIGIQHIKKNSVKELSVQDADLVATLWKG